MGTVSEINPHSGELLSFFEAIWGDSDGYVYLPTKNPKLPKEEAFDQHFFPWPKAKEEVVQFVREQAHTADVYFAPALFNEPSATKQDFKESRVVWCEFDGVLPQSFKQDPTITVQSSTTSNQHVYWLLEDVISNASDLETINRGLTYLYGADASGWDATQILRPPTTQNYKTEPPKEVILLTKNAFSYSHSVFETYTSPEPLDEIPLGSIPDVTDLVFKYEWPVDASKLWRSSAPVGERSTMLMRLGYYCAEMGMGNEELYSVIRNADDRWGKFRDRSDRNRRLLDLIEKVRIKHPLISEEEGTEHFILGWNTLLETEYEIDWLIPDVLQKQGYMLFTGPSGVGKTQFSLQIGKSLALGTDFLDLGITEQRRILFISCEMGLVELKEFMNNMSKDLDPSEILLLEQNFKIEPRGEPFYVDNEAGQRELCSIIEYIKPDILIFDSIGSATGGELSSELVVKKIMDFNDRIRQKYDLATWFIHHHRKASENNKKPKSQDDVYGSNVLFNRATSVFTLWPGKHDNELEVIELKRRLSQKNEPWMIARTEGLNFMRTLPAAFQKATHLVHKQPETPSKKLSTLTDTL